MRQIALMPKFSIFLSSFILLLFSFFSFFGCSRTSKKDNSTVKFLQESIENSSKTLRQCTESHLKLLEDKTLLPETKERADLWLAKAINIKRSSAKTIEIIKLFLKKRKIDYSAAENIFIQISHYIDSINNIDPNIKQRLLYDKFASSMESYKKLKAKEFYTLYFKGVDSSTTSAVLSKIQNDIFLIETRLIKFCLDQVGMVDGYGFYSFYSGIIGQNSTIFKPGDFLEIRAGIGAFSWSAQPKIKFGDKLMPLEDGATATYRSIVPERSGKYTVPVSISYFNQVTGHEELMKVDIEYTVTKPCDQ